MMAVALQTLLDRSNNNMNSGTHQVVRDTALEVIRRAYKEGIYVQISEGNRSNARQQELYNQGRTTGGSIVTNAKPGQSWHNYGIAVDFFLTTTDGSKAVWKVDDNWKRVASIAKSLGFEWGGDWKSFVDNPHLQMTGGLSLAQLQAGQKPKLTSKVGNKTPAPSKPSTTSKNTTTNWINKPGTWTGGVLKKGHKGSQVKQLQTLLAAKYFYPDKGAKNNGIDSYYGDDTADAVRRFQLIEGIKSDGIAGKDTYEKLKGKSTSTKKKKASTSSKLPNTTYEAKKPYPSTAGVKKVQNALASIYFYPNKGAKNNGVDGSYGPKTADAVKRFQSVNGLKADGIYGPDTRKVLLKKMK